MTKQKVANSATFCFIDQNKFRLKVNSIKMRKLFLLCFFISEVACSQSPIGNDAQADLVLMQNGTGMFRSFDNRYKGIEGFPTLFQKYQTGRIKMVSGKIFAVDSMNLDIVSNELLVKRNNIGTIVDKNMVDEFEIGDTKYLNVEDITGENNFYALLLDGKYRLLKRDIKFFMEPSNKGAYSNGALSARFEESKKYYVIFDGNLNEIRNKKQFVGQFSSEAKIIEDYMRKGGLSVKTEKDLLEIFKFINEL
jgi:hypothetical protein